MNPIPDAPLRILVVEDEPGDLGLIQIYLRRAGYAQEGGRDTLLIARSLEEAREKTGDEPADLVLLDLNLPDSAGLDTITAIRKLMPGAAIIVMSGNADVNVAVAALQLGARDYLIKGMYEHDALGKTIRQAMERSFLEQRLQLLEAALKATNSAVLITDIDSRIEWANPAFTRLTGYTPDEVQGKMADRLCLLGHEQETEPEPWYAVLAGAPRNREGSCRRKDGSPYDEELTISPVPDARGRVTHFIAVKQDISARKEAEKNLQAALQRNRLLFESSRDALMTLAPPSWRFTSANPATLRLFGASSEEEFTSVGPWAVSPERQPDGRLSSEKAQEMIAIAMREGVHSFEWEHCKLHGAPFPADVLLTRMELGDEVFLQATVRDITERHAAERVLRESEERWKFALEGAGDGVWDWDVTSGKIVFSRRWYEIQGFTEGSLGDDVENWRKLVHPDDLPLAEKLLQAHFRGETGSFNCEHRVRCGNGEYKWILGRGMVVRRDPEGNPLRVIGTHTDITERKRAADQMKESLSLLQATLESTTDAILVVGLDRTWVLYNKPFVDMWRIPAEVLASRDDHAALEYVSGQLQDPQAFLDRVRELYAQPDATSFDIIRFKDGRIIERHSLPQRMDGKVTGRVWSFHDVTAYKQAEEKLDASNRLLNNIVENLPAMIFLKDAQELRFRLFNRAGEELVGHKREDLLGRNDHDFFPKEQADFFNAKDREVLAQDQVVDIAEEPIETPRGTRLLHTKKIAIRDDQGQPLFLLGISEDITERRQNELALAAAHAEAKRLADALDHVDAYVYMKDLESRYTYANKATLQLFNCSAEELTGSPDSRFFPPETVAHLRQIDERVLKQDANTREEVTVTDASGKRTTYLEIKTPMYGRAGDIIGLCGISQDITERKNTEEALARNEANLRAILDNIPYLVWLKDTDSRFIAINQPFLKTTGRPDMSEVIGKTDFDLWPEELARKYRDDDLDVMNKLAQKLTEEKSLDNGAISWVETFKAPVLTRDGKLLGTTGFARDITERKRAEELVQYMAHHDPLTGLPNRALFSDRLHQALAIAKRDKLRLALLFIDLDKFKPINDELGHEVGDLLLKEAAQRLQDCIRESDTVARIGGDEFVVLLPEIEQEQDALLVAEKTRNAMKEPFLLAGQSLHISSSTGIAVYPEHGVSDTQLVKSADIAMYCAKTEGRDRVVMYQVGMKDA